MKALAFGFRAFMNLLRCTATSDSLRELASALESGGPSALHNVIKTHESRSAARSGRQTRVVVDYSKSAVFFLTIATRDCEKIAEGLRRLAAEPDGSTTSLAELGLLTRDTSKNDLEFYKRDEVPDLKRDYSPDVPGSTWEGVLYHSEATMKQFQQVREVILEWAATTSDGRERELFAVTPEGEDRVDLAVAHRRLHDPNDQTYQINTYIDHPLVVRYGNPHTGAQLWLTRECSEIIISEHCVASGDFHADIRNFLSYRRVLLSLSEVLDTAKFAWGDCADTWPMDKASDPASFADEDEMWATFVTGLEPSLGGVPIPPSVRSAFGEMFAEECRHPRL